MALLTVQNLTVGYESHVILENVSFSVNPGDYLCIVGKNGSGKTSLMKTILRLQPAISGEILYGDGLKANGIGYLPQQTVVQKDFPATVNEVVLSGCQGRCGIRPFYTKEEKKLAEIAMTRMEITSLTKKSYRELSGGQQQRVLLARAFCATGKLLLLDEPVSGLDPDMTEELYHLIEEINRENTAIIMITHDPEAVKRYASHILHVGNICFFGTASDYRLSETGRRYLQEKDGYEI